MLKGQSFDAIELVNYVMNMKVLWTPEETAWSLGFTHSAFRQAEWSKEIPMKKVGIKDRYRPEDVRMYRDNLPIIYPR
jgi:hypothetical protein